VKKASKNEDRPPSGDRGRLTLKQRKFGLAFVGEANGNGVEAARLARYKGSDLTLAVVAHENLRKPNIQRFIEQLRSKAEAQAAAHILSATEVLVGLTRFAKADVADLFPENEWMQEAKQRGVSRLIKSINFDKDTGKLTKLELHNAHGAHVDLGKYHKLFVDKLEIVQPEDLDAALERELARVAGADQEAGAGETPSETVH
jgi:phage terminase small subunit